jgi:release factor glutamine methyltransferase
LDITVNEDVLIPRPETELLVEIASDLAGAPRSVTHGKKILDLCTGSGCIAIALTKRLSDCKIVASDISDRALSVARKNAAKHSANGIEFVKSDLFSDLKGTFDLIVSNPPYISGPEFSKLQKEVLMEPRVALYGGEDGLDFYRRIFRGAGNFLNKGGYVAVEIGYSQARAVKDVVVNSAGFETVEVKKDFNGIDRILVARWTSWS